MKNAEATAPQQIRTTYLHLTRACNLGCEYCYFDAGEQMAAELTHDELRKLLEEIELISPQKVVFTGGEPLLRNDVYDTANAFRNIFNGKNTVLCLISNGILIDRRVAQKVAKYFDEVRISVDGPEEINDKIRGNGAFRGALKAIRNLRNAGINPSVSITITSLNLPVLAEFLSFLLDETFVTEFHLVPFRPVGRGAERQDLICSWKEAQIAITDFWCRRFGRTSTSGVPNDYSLVNCGNCGVGSYINIWPDGSVYPCHVLSVPDFLLGNVRQTALPEIIMESETLRRLENLDFKHLLKYDDHLRAILKDAICFGEVYRDAREKIEEFLMLR